jgi:hypothetical protein
VHAFDQPYRQVRKHTATERDAVHFTEPSEAKLKSNGAPGREMAGRAAPDLKRTMQKRMRSVKQLTMYLWEDSGLTVSGNHQVIAALESLCSSGAATRGRPATAGVGPPGRIGGAG